MNALKLWFLNLIKVFKFSIGSKTTTTIRKMYNFIIRNLLLYNVLCIEQKNLLSILSEGCLLENFTTTLVCVIPNTTTKNPFKVLSLVLFLFRWWTRQRKENLYFNGRVDWRLGNHCWKSKTNGRLSNVASILPKSAFWHYQSIRYILVKCNGSMY